MRILLYGILGLLLSTQTACSQSDSVDDKQVDSANSKAVIAEDLELNAFHDKLETIAGQLLDVRTPEEYADGHLPKAMNINFFDDDFLQHAVADLDKGKPLFIYCASGNRSGKAKESLLTAGFTEVYNLTGAGYKQWKAKGFPTE